MQNFQYKDLKEHYIDFIENTKIQKSSNKDRQAMKYSIETRLPFMDHGIVELGLTFPRVKYLKTVIQSFHKSNGKQNSKFSFIFSKARYTKPQTSWLMTTIFDFIYDVFQVKVSKREVYNQSKSKIC